MQEKSFHRNVVVSARLPALTREQIDQLIARWECSIADLFTILVDRAYQQEFQQTVQVDAAESGNHKTTAQ